MNDQFVKYILMLIAVFMGALDIGSAVRCFSEGKYFVAGVYSMLSVWMICLFVWTFFEI